MFRKSLFYLFHRSQLNLVLNAHHDDDGFESLNGNGSRTSEEEVVPAFSLVQNLTDKTKAESDKDVDNDEVASNCSSRNKCATWIKSQLNDTPFRRVANTDSESDKESDCKQPMQVSG